MARIFLSYSRVDSHFVKVLADNLRQIYGYDQVWFDEGLHGGDIWWEEILEQIAASDIFIYVLSNDSVQSSYCRAEFTEARRLQKRIITVQARDRTRLTDELQDVHYINMANRVDDANALIDLFSSINRSMNKVSRRARKPLWQPITPRPDRVEEKPRPLYAAGVDTPTLNIPHIERENVPVISKSLWEILSYAVPILVGLTILAQLLVHFNNQLMIEVNVTSIAESWATEQAETLEASLLLAMTDTTEPTETASATSEATVTDRFIHTHTVSLTGTSTATYTSTATPTLDFALLAQGTLDAEDTLTATLRSPTPTENIPGTVAIIAANTRNAGATATATFWTTTPTETQSATFTPAFSPILSPTQDLSAASISNAQFIVLLSGNEIGRGHMRVYHPFQVKAPETARIELELILDSYYVTPTPVGPRTEIPAGTPAQLSTTVISISPTPRELRYEGISRSITFFPLMGASLLCPEGSFSNCDPSLTAGIVRSINRGTVRWSWDIMPKENISGKQGLVIELWLPAASEIQTVDNLAVGTDEDWAYPFEIEVIPQVQPVISKAIEPLVAPLAAIAGSLLTLIGIVWAARIAQARSANSNASGTRVGQAKIIEKQALSQDPSKLSESAATSDKPIESTAASKRIDRQQNPQPLNPSNEQSRRRSSRRK